MSVESEILARAELDSFWKLDEAAGPTYADSVGAVTGTEFNTPTDNQPAVTPGSTGTSVLFTRTNPDAIDFGDVYDFTGSATFTVYCWLKPIAYDAGSGHFLWSNIDASARGWALQFVNPAVTLRMLRGDAAGFDQVEFAMSEATYEDGVAKQVAMSYDGTNLVLNIDGVNVASGASAKTLVAPTTNTGLRFAAYAGGGSGYDGYADNLAIFTPNLVEADLAAIYAAGFPAAPTFRISRSNLRW